MKQFTTITVIGRDKTGVIARVTNFLFEQHANIEALEEQVTRGQFSMTLQASWKDTQLATASVEQGLARLAAALQMEIKLRFTHPQQRQRVAIPWNERATAEKKLLKVLDAYEVDFLILARFMKILSPNVVWRFKNKIINVHPSLLPSFPGGQAYRQAYEHGVKIAGVTAHFV